MNQTKTGTFISECRKEKRMTQAQLAEKLNITDRAVSKWETGKSMPDSSVMLELCEILGITVNELLSGERIDMESYEKKADENLIALKRKDENHMAKNVVIAALFSAVLLGAVMICIICNIAVSGHLTWSLIPVSSIVFAWVILFPGLILGRRGIILSYVSWSIFTVPYLFLLGNIIKVREVYSVGAVIAVVSIIFLWILVAVFKQIGKKRKLAALGLAFLSAIYRQWDTFQNDRRACSGCMGYAVCLSAADPGVCFPDLRLCKEKQIDHKKLRAIPELSVIHKERSAI